MLRANFIKLAACHVAFVRSYKPLVVPVVCSVRLQTLGWTLGLLVFGMCCQSSCTQVACINMCSFSYHSELKCLTF